MARFDNIAHETEQAITVTETKQVLPTIINRMEWQKRGLSFTASGYGARIPTAYMVKYNGRWHRVYCRIYSNVGSTYIVSKGRRIWVNN